MSTFENTTASTRSNDPFYQALSYYTQLGFQTKTIWEAWKNVKQRPHLLLEEIIRLTSEQNSSIVNSFLSSSKKDDSELKIAVALSLKSQASEMNIEDCKRKEGIPSGLANLGQTCYFNVLIQTLFSVKKFRQLLLELDIPSFNHHIIGNKLKGTDKEKLLAMVEQFQELFAVMIKGKKSFQDPKGLFNSLKELNGEEFQLGEQNDFWEFQNSTFELLEKCFDYVQEANTTKESVNSIFVSSLMPLSSEKQTDKKSTPNKISALFFGSQRECISYMSGKNQVRKYNESIQGSISLEVKHADLYKALRTSQLYNIPDFEVSEGLKTNAHVETKFKKIPEILNFYINRLEFDKKSMKAVKLHDFFYFNKEINLDSFAIDSDNANINGGKQSEAIVTREEALKKRDEELEKLDRQIEKMEKKLKECSNPDCTSAKLQSSFESVVQFLKKQQHNSEEFIDIDDFDMGIDKAEGDFGLVGSAAELQTTISILTNYKDRFSAQSESLSQKLEKLRKTRSEIYAKSSDDNVYSLFSILMHQGSAESGHYFCYIYQEETKKWFRYSDISVREADENTLFTEAFGGPSSDTSACSLFYKKIDSKSTNKAGQQASQQNLNVISKPLCILSDRLKKRVEELDIEFEDSLEIEKVVRALEPVRRRLTGEIAKKNAVINSKKDSIDCIGELLEFENFLLNLSQFRRLGIIEILKRLLVEFNYNDIKKQISKPQNLQKGQDSFVAHISKTMNLPSQIESQDELILLKEQHEQLKLLVNEFNQVLKISSKVDNLANVLKSLGGILLGLKEIDPSIIEGSLLAKHLKEGVVYLMRVEMLKGCFNIDCQFQRRNTSSVISDSNAIILTLMNFLEEDQQVIQQVKANLLSTLEIQRGTLSQELWKQLKASTDKIDILSNMRTNNSMDLRKAFCLQFGGMKGTSLGILAQEIVKNWNDSLRLLQPWRQFLDRIQATGKIISSQERLDEEEILYPSYF